MRYIELPEKLEIFMDIILNYELLIVMLITLLILTFLVINKNISKKKYLTLSFTTFLIGLVATIILNNEVLMPMFNDIIKNVFIDIYFPSVEIYLLMLSVSLVVLIISLLSSKMKKTYKISNILMFFTLFFLLISFLLIVSDDVIDIFNQNSIYTNESCIVLLQLSTQTFEIWLVITLIIYIINTIVEKVDVKNKNIKLELVDNNNIEPVVVTNSNNQVFADELIEIIIENDEEIINFDKEESLNDIITKLEEDDFVIENPIIRPVTKFSLEEYKVFSRMLKDTILLNSYKDKITKEDMLNPVSLKSIYSNEEYAIYKKMLKTYID